MPEDLTEPLLTEPLPTEPLPTEPLPTEPTSKNLSDESLLDWHKQCLLAKYGQALFSQFAGSLTEMIATAEFTNSLGDDSAAQSVLQRFGSSCRESMDTLRNMQYFTANFAVANNVIYLRNLLQIIATVLVTDKAVESADIHNGIPPQLRCRCNLSMLQQLLAGLWVKIEIDQKLELQWLEERAALRFAGVSKPLLLRQDSPEMLRILELLATRLEVDVQIADDLAYIDVLFPRHYLL